MTKLRRVTIFSVLCAVCAAMLIAVVTVGTYAIFVSHKSESVETPYVATQIEVERYFLQDSGVKTPITSNVFESIDLNNKQSPTYLGRIRVNITYKSSFEVMVRLVLVNLWHTETGEIPARGDVPFLTGDNVYWNSLQGYMYICNTDNTDESAGAVKGENAEVLTLPAAPNGATYSVITGLQPGTVTYSEQLSLVVLASGEIIQANRYDSFWNTQNQH